MARVVLVHGIGQQNSSKHEQEQLWLPSLVKGVLTSGHPHAADVAAELTASLRPGHVPLAQMAFYGDLYLPDGVQGGDGDVDPATEQIADELAEALLRTAAGSGDVRTADEARQAMRQLDPAITGAQGAGAVARRAMSVVDNNPWLAARIFGLAQRARPDLLQVARYLADPELRTRIKATVTDLIDDDTVMIIGHSLGSVVAWEACQELAQPIRSLLTLGSPLGLGGVVYPRIRPQPPGWPARVARWVNIAHHDDIIAVEPALRGLFPSGDHRTIEDHATVSGHDHHGGSGYLEEPEAGRAVADALRISLDEPRV